MVWHCMYAYFFARDLSRNRNSSYRNYFECYIFRCVPNTTVLPYIALAYITSHASASEATSSLYLTPVTACFIAWIWLGEVPTLVSIIGGGITILEVVIAHLTFNKDNYKQIESEKVW
ncbi:EamA family transporter [Bacillus mycoides]|uniref:EamA family transporter n=1 Tax=Bacillus mycoides TaxID=1405 RepID=UPI003B3AADEC